MHYQNLGQRPQVKLLRGLLMLLTVRAIPEEKVQIRKTEKSEDTSVMWFSPYLTEAHSGLWNMQFLGGFQTTSYFHSVGRTSYWTRDLGKTKSASRLAEAGNKIV